MLYQIVLWITRYFTQKLYVFKNLWLRVFIYWSMDQNSKPLEIGDKINITLVINQNVKHN